MKACPALVALAVLLVSCGPIVKSVPIDPNTGNPVVEPPANGGDGSKGAKKTSNSGAIYFLPRSYFKIKIAPKNGGEGQGAQAGKENGQESQPDKKKRNAKVQSTIQNNVTVSVSGTTEKDSQGGSGSPGHDIELEFERSGFKVKAFTFTLDVVTTIDPEKVYYLQYVPSPSSDDDVDIAVKNFFISSVKTTAENKSDEIALKSVELIKQAVLLGTGLPGAPQVVPPVENKGAVGILTAPADQPKQQEGVGCPGSIDIEVDPIQILINTPPEPSQQKAGVDCNQPTSQNQKTADNAKNSSKSSGKDGSFDAICNNCNENKAISCLPPQIDIQLKRFVGPYSSTENPGNEGVYYRAAFPYRLIVKAKDKDGITKVVERIVLLPNESPAYLFDLRRTAFVKKTYDVQFENGFLTSAKINKPSELLAGVSLPVDIIKSIASIPGEIIQLKINYNSQQQALLEAEKTRFESLKAFNDAVLEMYKTNANQTQTLIEQLKK